MSTRQEPEPLDLSQYLHALDADLRLLKSLITEGQVTARLQALEINCQNDRDNISGCFSRLADRIALLNRRLDTLEKTLDRLDRTDAKQQGLINIGGVILSILLASITSAWATTLFN
ncbi:MAG: hypothetical protein J7647_32085 [Cyanobacteria bacterium SBLK]|nr:hypothetical protein [Cyanobacteria bacterium SBLK]